MTTMNEIKKMTGEELADFLMKGGQDGPFLIYVGCEDGLFFIPNIEGHEIRYTLGLDNRGIVAGALRLGLLKEEEIGDPDDLSDYKIRELAEIYWKYEEEIDRDAIKFMRDEIIEDLEKELEEIKKWED